MAPTPVARRFARFVEDANAPTEAAEAMRDASMTLMPETEGVGLLVADASMTLMPETEGVGLLVATARKANPVTALRYGLGAQRSAMLPGWFGDFLLSAEQGRTALPRAEGALLLSSTQRSAALTRVTTCMTAMGDAPNFDAVELIEAPVRVIRHAAETGSGAAAFSRWY